MCPSHPCSMQKHSLVGIGLPQGLDLKRSGTELTIANHMDLVIELHRMLLNFSGSGHPIFRCTSTLERGQLRRKDCGKTAIHFNESTQNIELLLQMVISINQLSLYGVCNSGYDEELPVGWRASGKPVASGQWMNEKLLHNLLSQKCKPMKSERETCRKNMSNDLRNYQKTCKYSELHPNAFLTTSTTTTNTNTTITLQYDLTQRATGWLFASGSSWTPGHTGGSRQDTQGTQVPEREVRW